LFSGTRGSARTADAGSRAATDGTSTSPAPSLPLDSRLLPARELLVPGRLPMPTDPDNDAADIDNDDDPADPADAAADADAAEKGDAADAGDAPDAAGVGASPQTVQ
jgi:hypothetical protein